MRRFRYRNGPWTLAITGLGALLGLGLVVEGFLVLTRTYPLPGGYRIGVASSLPFIAALLFGGYWLEASHLSDERYERVAKWCLGGCLGFAVFVTTITVVARPTTALLVGSTVRWSASVGGGVGFLIGLFEARAIEQAIVSEQLRQRQRRTQRERDRLEQFANVVSHDLRNPLNVAQGRLELVRETCDSEHLEDVERAHARMAELIDDLLAMARVGQQTADLEPVDLGEVAAASWQNVAAPEATLDVATDRTVLAAETRLRQLFENLFRNAVEHGGADVTIAVGDLDGGFYVADDGPGIPPGERSDVFDMGYTSREAGTGFGLAIVEEVAEAHGWEVRVTEAADGGARFEVTGVDFDRRSR